VSKPREGLLPIGAVVERSDVAVTANKPRYALTAAFAALFDPSLVGEGLQAVIAAWQGDALNTGALARIAIVRKGGATAVGQVLVTSPTVKLAASSQAPVPRSQRP
jgi:hypothetical protein